MTEEFLLYTLAGFLAQLIDGALGMAYGVTATSILLTAGVPPIAASATVHAAECFSTGASALSHHAFGNISKLLSGRSQLQRARGQLRNHVGVNRLRLGVLPLQNLTSCGTVCVCNVAQALHLLLHLLLH